MNSLERQKSNDSKSSITTTVSRNSESRISTKIIVNLSYCIRYVSYNQHDPHENYKIKEVKNRVHRTAEIGLITTKSRKNLAQLNTLCVQR